MARKQSKRWLWVGLGAVAIWWSRPFRVRVEGHSMTPEIEPGDWLVAVRPRRLCRGDVVVVEHPERPGFELVKRLEGLPGDTIGGLTLGVDQYWIVGGPPAASTDSRWFGPVGRTRIRGVVVVRYWPPGRISAVRCRRP